MNEPPSDHKMTLHLFGKADSTCIAAYALKRTATDSDNACEEQVREIIRKNFYMDDCLFSVPATERAIKAALHLVQLLRKGNLHLTKSLSNDKKVLAAIPAEKRPIKNLDFDKLPIERALGVH